MRSGLEIPDAESQMFGSVAIMWELLHISPHTGWMRRDSEGQYVVDELYLHVRGRYRR